MIPAVLAAVWFGGGPFLLLLAVGIGLMGIEWAKMSTPHAPAEVAVAITVAVLTAVFAAYNGLYVIAWLLMAGGSVVSAVASRHKAERAADAAYGVIYIAPAMILMVWLRNPVEASFAWPIQIPWPPGADIGWMLLLLATTWSADIGAFLVGKLAKGPKLWPRISPNKTWSGFVGGLGASLGAGAAVAAWYQPIGITVLQGAAFGFAGGAATMAGDLWESVLKRRFGVKDSGDLIPGHGGILDRVDGLMFAAVAIAVCRLGVNQGWFG
jgi:phosphatidate cytidylyltransferase